jgi:hypothetical protein
MHDMRRGLCWSAVAVVVLVCVSGTVFAQSADYPISVVTEQVSPSLTKDVVHVKLADGSTPTLNAFMEEIVPASLKAGSGLPAPAATGTLMTDVVIPNSKSMHIFNAGNLPVRLRVRAQQHSGAVKTNVTEDRHERFRGRVDDPGTDWTVQSYFVTEFTAAARVTKYHTNRSFKYEKVVTARGTHKGFHWVDP